MGLVSTSVDLEGVALKMRRDNNRRQKGKERPRKSLFWNAIIDKGGFLLISCFYSLFIPFPAFVAEWPRHCGRLRGINKDCCWQIKVTGWDGGLLNIHFTSHKSAAASRRQCTTCN